MRSKRSFNLYLIGVITSGLALAAYGLATESWSELIGTRPILFATFAALLLVAEARPVSWFRVNRNEAVVSVGPSFSIALLFLSAGLGPAIAAGVLSAIGDVASKRGLVKTLFNAAMMTLTLAIPGAILGLGGDRLTLINNEAIGPQFMAVAIAALLVHNLVNTSMVITVVALSEGLSVMQCLRRDLVRSVSTDSALLALGPLTVLVAVRSILFLPVLLGVTLLVLNTTRMALDRLHQATHDPLTDLPNRRYFDQHLKELIEGRRRSARSLAVMVLDLDGFKAINDTLGHDVGDRVLISVADRLQAVISRNGMVARLGGDEFAIAITRCPEIDEMLVALGQSIHDGYTGSLDADGLPLTIAGSMGIARHEAGVTPSQLMRRADLAMYDAKSQGGGVVLHEQGTIGSVDSGSLAMLDRLGPAIAGGQLFLNYQPIMDVRSGLVTRMEALVRWRHPDHGISAPDDFIPTVVQTDLIQPLTSWVLEQAIGDCVRFQQAGHSVGVTVNLSSRTITDQSFPAQVATMLADAGLDPGLLTLELTENTIIVDAGRAMQVMDELRDVGVGLALDDFGSGYSSLANLRRMPLNMVKIDRSFVTGMLDDGHNAAIVSMVTELASQLGFEVVAEGIEDQQVLEQVQTLGCHHAQGFFIARPMEFGAAATWLDRRGAIHDQPVFEART